MTDTKKTLVDSYQPLKKDVSPGAIYTVPGSTSAIVRTANISNREGVRAMCILSSSRNTSGELCSVMLPPYTSITVPLNHKLAAAESIFARQISEPASSTQLVMDNPGANTTSTTDTNSYASASWTSQNNECYIANVYSSHGTAALSPNSVTDTHPGISWTQFQTVVSVDGQVRLTQFRAQATGSSSTTTTFGFASNQTGCIIHIGRINGAATSGSNGDEAIQAAGTYAPVAWPTTPAVLVAKKWCGYRYATYAGRNSTGSGSLPGALGMVELFDSNNVEALHGQTYQSALQTIGEAAGHTASVTLTLGLGTTSPVASMVNIQDSNYPIYVSLHGVEIT